ncbi:MAG: DMT family transporter [Gammaproteobacteria bacterium]
MGLADAEPDQSAVAGGHRADRSGAQLALVYAYQAADMGAVEPITFLRLIWASLIGYVFFAQIPDIWTLLGGFIIFASATYVVRREARLRRAKAAS